MHASHGWQAHSVYVATRPRRRQLNEALALLTGGPVIHVAHLYYYLCCNRVSSIHTTIIVTTPHSDVWLSCTNVYYSLLTWLQQLQLVGYAGILVCVHHAGGSVNVFVHWKGLWSSCCVPQCWYVPVTLLEAAFNKLRKPAQKQVHTLSPPLQKVTLSFFVNVGYFLMQTRNWTTSNTLLSALHIVIIHAYART